jgi:UDP-MurNAc hydroxylase
MKVSYHQSACVLIESNNTKILCDPWLIDGAYLGSWCIYPPYDFQPSDFDDIDYIYISHIHPDHFDPKTLNCLRKDVPVLIHDFPAKILKNSIERLGFKTIELEHDKRVHLKNNIFMNILAADNCDPQLCGQYIGCVNLQYKTGSNWIDTMCVIDDGNYVIVNTNDCPFDLAQFAAMRINSKYKKVDMLLNGYSGASAFPHMFKMTENESVLAAQHKKSVGFQRAENYIKLLKPRFFLPFSGRYTLGGNLSKYNGKTGEPELEEGFEYLVSKIDQTESKGLLLNNKENFNLTTEKSFSTYTPIDPEHKKNYIKNILSKRKMDYDDDPEPTIDEIKNLISKSFDRFESVRKNNNFSSDTVIIIDFDEEELVSISSKGEGFKFFKNNDVPKYEKYVKMQLDKKLLKRLLEGPSKAHWNIAEGGSHIYFERVPDVYERSLFYNFYYFYA